MQSCVFLHLGGCVCVCLGVNSSVLDKASEVGVSTANTPIPLKSEMLSFLLLLPDPCFDVDPSIRGLGST